MRRSGVASHGTTQDSGSGSHLVSNMLGLGMRFAARSIVLSRTSVPARHPLVRRDGVRHLAFRTFSTTPRRSAEEAHDEFIDAIKHTALFQKLADKPNAIKALSEFYALTKEMGAVPLSFFCKHGALITTIPYFFAPSKVSTSVLWTTFRCTNSRQIGNS